MLQTLQWEEVKNNDIKNNDIFNKRITLVARDSFRYFPPKLSQLGELREVEGSLWFSNRYFLSERIHNPMDDTPYCFILIVNGNLHYYVKTVEDGKAIAEVINRDILKYYKELYTERYSLSSKDLAELVVDGLIPKVLDKDKFEEAVEIAEEEINARKAMNDY